MEHDVQLTWELILGIKVITLLDCLKTNILLFSFYFQDTQEKNKTIHCEMYIDGQDSQLGNKIYYWLFFFFLVSSLLDYLPNSHPQISKVFGRQNVQF